MAEKTQGGGGFTWLAIGFLLGVAVTLGGLAFLSHDPDSTPVAELGSGAAAPPAETAAPATVQPQLSGGAIPGKPGAVAQGQAPAPVPSAMAPAPSAPSAENVDPEVADDAAAAGMTSRAPSR
jgi:hypothetical protein